MVVGIDVGGTRTKAALVTDSGVVLAHVVRPTPPDIGSRLGVLAAETVAELAASPAGLAEGGTPAVRAVGVVVPGLVDDVHGVGVWSVNLGWRDLDLHAAVATHVDLPVAVGHDVRAGLLAEHRLGAARGETDALFVPIGTGIAGALLSGGRVLAGSPWAGEIGHVTVVPDGPPCGCGRRGCLEAVASAAAIGRRWTELSGVTGDAEDVAGRADAGNPLARRIWSEAVEALACVVAPVVAAAGTRLVVVGGGLVQAGDTLLRPLRTALAARLGPAHDVEVTAAALGDRAGSLGAALLALDRVGA